MVFAEMEAEVSTPLCTHHIANDELSRATKEFTEVIRRELGGDSEE